MILDITILHKFNDRDYRNEPIQYKENVELDELKSEVEKITHTQLTSGEYKELVESKHLHIETVDMKYTFQIV